MKNSMLQNEQKMEIKRGYENTKKKIIREDAYE